MIKSLLTLLFITLPMTAQAAGGPRVLALGDSLTEGYGVAREAAWPALVEAELRTQGLKDAVVINAGVSGSTSASGLSRLKWHLKSKDKADVLLLALGANDGLRGLDLKATRQNLVDVIRLAKSQGMKVMLAGMLIPPNYGKEYADSFQKLFPEVAKSEGTALIPFLLDGVAAEPKLNLPDGIHPNEAGYKIVAKTVTKYLVPVLKP